MTANFVKNLEKKFDRALLTLAAHFKEVIVSEGCKQSQFR